MRKNLGGGNRYSEKIQTSPPRLQIRRVNELNKMVGARISLQGGIHLVLVLLTFIIPSSSLYQKKKLQLRTEGSP
jgi:hypothetical protein